MKSVPPLISAEHCSHNSSLLEQPPFSVRDFLQCSQPTCHHPLQHFLQEMFRHWLLMTHPLLSPFSLPLAATAPLKLLRHGHCCLPDTQPALFTTAPHSPGLPSELRDTAARLAAGTKALRLSYLTAICWEFSSPLSLVTCQLCPSVRHFWLLSLPLPPDFSASTDRQPVCSPQSSQESLSD